MYRSLENHIRGIMSKRYITEDETKDKEEVTVGGYQTRHFDMCADASKLYKNIESKVDDVDLAKRAAKLHDNFFRIKKEAQEEGEIEDEAVMSAKNLKDQIMKMAKMMGLEKEHKGYMDFHMNEIEKMDRDEEDDDDHMEEQNNKPPFSGGTKTTGPRKDRYGNVIKKQNVAKHLAKKAMRKQMGESVLDQPIMRANPEDNEPASPDEKGMALQQLRFIKYATDEIAAHIDGDGRFPEWMQNKLTKANYIMKGLHSYIDHEYSEGMKESVELEEMFASTVEPHKDGFRPKVVKTHSGGKTTMSYLGQHVYKSKEHARDAADHIANAHRKGRASDSYIDSLARRHHKEHGMKESANVNVDEADFDKNFTKRVGATARGGKGADYLKKKADQTREYGAKQDPGAAKKGLGPAVVDRQKAYQKARKKGLPPGQRVAYSGTYSKDRRRLPEEMELIEANAFANAGRALNDYARKSGGIDKADFEKASKMMYQIGKADIMTKGTHLGKFSKFFKDLDTDVRDRIVMILKQNNIMESVELEEKAVSQQQQKLMGLALSVKRGDTPESEVTPVVRKMAKTMSTKELEKFAGTKHKGLPKEVEEVKSAPKGYHFTRSGQLKKGDADQDGDGGKMLRSDPLDKQRKKIPPLPESRFNRILENAIKKKS